MHVCEIKMHVMRSLKDMNQDYCRLATSAFWANSSKDFFFYHSFQRLSKNSNTENTTF